MQTLLKQMSTEGAQASRMSVDTGPFNFHYIIEGPVCYLTLTGAIHAYIDRSALHVLQLNLSKQIRHQPTELCNQQFDWLRLVRRRMVVAHFIAYAKHVNIAFYAHHWTVLPDRGYPKKLAYQYLEDLHTEFTKQYGHQIETAARPYAFIKFGELFLGRQSLQTCILYLTIKLENWHSTLDWGLNMLIVPKYQTKKFSMSLMDILMEVPYIYTHASFAA